MNGRRQQIYLVGFMGSGKSTVGPLLAEALGRPFFDLDSVVEEKSGRTIAEIFESEGEHAFRNLERECFKELADGPDSVIALGGGAYLEESNRGVMSDSGLTVWLRVSFETARARALGDRRRPLAQDPDRFQALFRQRQSVYREAPLQVDTDGLQPEQICERILGHLSSSDSPVESGDKSRR